MSMKEEEPFKILLHNIVNYISFGISLYKKGICDKIIKGKYTLLGNSEIFGYTKEEAANMCNLSVRQFDRKIKQGKLPKGKKVKNYTSLFWDKDLIDKVSKLKI